MPHTSTFHWNGGQVTQQLYLRVRTTLDNIGVFLTQKMSAYAPVKTGYLKQSINYVHAVNEPSITVYIPPFYGVYQEFGTRFIRPHPFVRPALLEAAARWHFNVVNIHLFPAAQISEPLRAHTAGFHLPTHQLLTPRQHSHVQKHLVPTSQRYAHAFRRRKVKFGVKGP